MPACCAHWRAAWSWASIRWTTIWGRPGKGRVHRRCRLWITARGAPSVIPASAWSCWALRLIEQRLAGERSEAFGAEVALILDGLAEHIAPLLDACGDAEMGGLLAALEGRFVPAGPSGAPSRGRPDVPPTGRNFFTADVRHLPTPTAWRLGVQAADRLLERHLQDEGDHLRQLGLSVWGTATMRTRGDDIAQALALMGVRPVWQPGSQRVERFDVLPLEQLGRPRVDVTLRVGLLPAMPSAT